LADARVRKLVADADAAMAEGEADAARAALADARRLSPDHAALAEAEQAFEVRSEYHAHLNAGDAARGRSDFAAAKAAYRRALAVLDTEQVRERLDDVEYAQSLAQAQAHLDRGDPTSALAMLRIAQQIRDTEQVRRMIDEV